MAGGQSLSRRRNGVEDGARIRKLGLATTTALILLVALLASPAPASASGRISPPGPAGPHSGARSLPVNAPAVGTRSPITAPTFSCYAPSESRAKRTG